MSKSRKRKYNLVECENLNCSTIFEILNKTMNERIRSGIPIYCPECMRIYTGKKLSEANKRYQERVTPEAKKEHYDKISKSSILTWRKKSSEEMERFSKNISIGLANMSNEARQQMCENQSKAHIERLKDPEERKKVSEATKIGMANMSSEAKIRMNTNQSIGVKKWYDELSEEDKKKHIQPLRDYQEKMITDPETAKEFSEAVREGQHNMRQEARDLWNLHKSYAKKCEWDKLSVNERDERITKMISNAQYYNKFHQNFEKYFINLLLFEKYYYKRELSLYSDDKLLNHHWDYGIYDKKTNELVAVVDLDGEFFHADSCDYNGIQSKEYLDEVRYLTIPKGMKSCIIYEHKFKESLKYLQKILSLSYEKFLEIKYEYFRNIQFPFPQYNDDELIFSYEQLCRLDCNDINHINNLSVDNRLGDRLIYHFHHSIFYDHYNDKLSPYDMWNNDKLLYNMIISNAILHNHLNINKIYQSFNLYSKVRFISAGRCKSIINKYLNKYDIIFNPNDQYSSIMLATVSMNKKYIGISTNDDLYGESLLLLAFLKKMIQNIDADIIHKDIIRKDIIQKYPYLFTYIRNNIQDIEKYKEKFICDKYLFVVDNIDLPNEFFDMYGNFIIEEIYNKNYENQYIILINR